MQTKGHRFEERWLKPSQIRVDSYQRSEKARLERRVKKILDHWDYDLVNMPKVSQRMDGTYYAFDGQATLAAWQQHEHDAPISLANRVRYPPRKKLMRNCIWAIRNL